MRASLRDLRVLLGEFRLTLATFAALLAVGTFCFLWLYEDVETGARLTVARAMYAVFGLVFFQLTLPFPEQPWLQLLYFAIPVVGLGALANGVVRFGVMLVNKHAREEEWQLALASTYRGHVVVCGLGKVGYRVTSQLVALGEDVVAIERDGARPLVAALQRMDVPVIVADARQRDVLTQAGVSRADALVACTEDDLTNLDIALDARELNPAIKVVMRMFDAQLAKKVERGFGIQTVFSVSALAAPAFVAAASRADVAYSFYLGDKLLNVSQVKIEPGSSLVGRTIGQVERERHLTVLQHRGGGAATLHPDADTAIAGDDCIVVFADLGTLASLATVASRKASP